MKTFIVLAILALCVQVWLLQSRHVVLKERQAALAGECMRVQLELDKINVEIKKLANDVRYGNYTVIKVK